MASTCYFENAMNRTWFLPSETERVCPGGCDPAYAIDNDGCWRCHCGSWEPVSAPPTLLFPDLAAYDGQRLWGDVWQDEEAAEFARLDAHAQRMRLLLEASKAREANEKLARAAALSEIAKAQSIVCDRSGKLKKQVLRPCRYFKFQGVLGSPEPGGTNKKGISWAAGCELHLKGCCEFIHPDQPEWAQFTEAAQPISRDGVRNFAALKSRRF